MTVLWVGCRSANITVVERDRSVGIRVSQSDTCGQSATWGRDIELADPIGARAVRDLTPSFDCD